MPYMRVTTVAPSMAMLNSVLAVSHGRTQAELVVSRCKLDPNLKAHPVFKGSTLMKENLALST